MDRPERSTSAGAGPCLGAPPLSLCRAWIGLGANLGDRRTTLERALQALQQLPGGHLVGHSRWWRSAPLDAHGPEFLNGVAAIDTSLTPLALLDHLQAIEGAHGRERPYPNAPRTLDLDLLLFGTQVLDNPRLQVPHPRMHQRAFVLGPLLDLDPVIDIPGQGSAQALMGSLTGQDCQPWNDPSSVAPQGSTCHLTSSP
jgi:2-amino-4-hydroxy-6-hydroxymethyldihydropteridine diphosphokinase